ncbi:MAG: transferrin-binding protein-like solute binding protein [Pseudomonadota bacterium]
MSHRPVSTHKPANRNRRLRAAVSRLPILLAFSGIAACSSTTGVVNGPFAPPLVGNEGTVPEPNENITVLSAASPARFSARDQRFEVASAFITGRRNEVTGIETVSSSQTTFDDPGGIVDFDRNTGSLTFDLAQDNVRITDTIGPLLLFRPDEDVVGFENPVEAITISSLPERFTNFFPGNVVLPNGATSVEELRNNPAAVDVLVRDLQEISNDNPSILGSTIGPMAAASLLEALGEFSNAIFDADFIQHEGSNGGFFSPLKIRGNNPGVEPNYAFLGLWNVLPVNNPDTDVTFGASVFGIQTPVEEVPNNGTASYDTTIGGYVQRDGDRVFLTGSVNLTADFSARRVNYDVLTILGTADTDGTTLFTPFVNLAGSGVIEANRFDGTLVGTDDRSLRGTVDGAFFGPRAAEVGGTLQFGNDDIQAVGGFVGTRQGDDIN